MNLIMRYHGKAVTQDDGGSITHPLAYHSLDVMVVVLGLLESSLALRKISLRAFQMEADDFPRLGAWLAFFVALHDIGKFHTLFQWMLRMALGEKVPPKGLLCGLAYFHGPESFRAFLCEYTDWLGVAEDDDQRYLTAWAPWMQAVAGHHGELPEGGDGVGRYGPEAMMAEDRAARMTWVRTLESLLLKPAGLSLSDLPPQCGGAARTFLAGLCSVSDWIGSNTDVFPFVSSVRSLGDYLDQRRQRLSESKALENFGLVAAANVFGGVESLLGEDESPRGVQTTIRGLPIRQGLTVIEAPTGSGKTEAALAHAWRLIDADLADSVVFALPTQATANGMLSRAEKFAATAFGSANVVLAHGKRNWSAEFQRLLDAAQATAQGREEAGVQCAAWLGQSRKRIFLGQIGVCTIDQALLAVLPVRHKFVRSFGIQRSVLIVDEVHAYDSYMHGLLGELLRQQREVGGSAILLSATLPSALRHDLLAAWGASRRESSAPYPVAWHVAGGDVASFEVDAEHRPKARVVQVERLLSSGAVVGGDLAARIMDAAKAGAKVGVVLNRVDDAQQLARQLRKLGGVPVDIFHSRYCYCDRMEKEQVVVSDYGRTRPCGGRILVATQVVEQSLDLDFDWLVTQICPVDLLFQRLGRLHRHERAGERPAGFEVPRCTVVSVEGEDYGSHALIYGNTRVLWRTDRLLSDASEIVFPEAYRDWIEKVYALDDWKDEPESVRLDHNKFRCMEIQEQREAIALTRISMTQFRDEESRVLSLTRGKEMGLTVLPRQLDGAGLDGDDWSGLDERSQAEVFSLNGVPVPATERWKGALHGLADDEGRYRLMMEMDRGGVGWIGRNGKAVFRYSTEFGLELVEGPGVVARPTPRGGEQNTR
jgi:CRISPR-associated endonuclease/helicase Cas3